VSPRRSRPARLTQKNINIEENMSAYSHGFSDKEGTPRSLNNRSIIYLHKDKFRSSDSELDSIKPQQEAFHSQPRSHRKIVPPEKEVVRTKEYKLVTLRRDPSKPVALTDEDERKRKPLGNEVVAGDVVETYLHGLSLESLDETDERCLRWVKTLPKRFSGMSSVLSVPEISPGYGE